MEFTYNIESKHIVWLKRQITIEADTLEGADFIAVHATNILLYNDQQELPAGVNLSCDIDIPYKEPMSLHQNGGSVTIEISRIVAPEQEVLVYDNLLGTHRQ